MNRGVVAERTRAPSDRHVTSDGAEQHPAEAGQLAPALHVGEQRQEAPHSLSTRRTCLAAALARLRDAGAHAAGGD